MFNFFNLNCKTPKNSMEQAKETSNVPLTSEVKPSSDDECPYTVGTTKSGNIVLKLGDEFNTTVTMNEAAVRKLIRMLKATLPEVDNDQGDKE